MFIKLKQNQGKYCELKRLPRNFPRLVKRKIYISYARPVLEYGSELFGHCSEVVRKALESVQDFCLVITGAYKATKQTNLLKECGLESLENRRLMKNMVLMYKIQNNIAPQYLVELCPSTVQNRQNYYLRNSNNLQ